MEFFQSPSFDPSYLLNDDETTLQPPLTLPTTLLLEPQNPHAIQVPNNINNIANGNNNDNDDDDLEHLLAQIPYFLNQDLQQHQQQKQQQKNFAVNRAQRRKSSSSTDNSNREKEKRRKDHREVERQRRHEMSSLHASLRSLLPLEYIKGKRSMSDHIDMASKYIQNLQEKIKVLNDKRDALKLEKCNNNSSKKASNYEVISVNPWDNDGGVEIIISTTCNCEDYCDDDQQMLPLSRVLQCLSKQGLDVVNCTSNGANNKLVHSIQAQVADGRSSAIDPVKLQQNIYDFLT